MAHFINKKTNFGIESVLDTVSLPGIYHLIQAKHIETIDEVDMNAETILLPRTAGSYSDRPDFNGV